MATFGERLKSLRKTHNYTQDELASKLYLDKSSISKYEHNKTIPENEVLRKIADLFDVTIDYLLCRTDIPSYQVIEGTLNGKRFKATVEASESYNIDGIELTSSEFEEFLNKLKKSYIDVNSIPQ